MVQTQLFFFYFKISIFTFSKRKLFCSNLLSVSQTISFLIQFGFINHLNTEFKNNQDVSTIIINTEIIIPKQHCILVL